ncbi:ABC transporter permease [Bosea sp. (in: a-proteobacteria)]|uniref:ABC transporter permease n=1 Tax=Bosea sp. (in: a-proteobacteria) TaxID=1871050 RepID=UPI0026103183|nr:ABC transporter permease subunit [Bosea sp. (in: a-proteobacteria)]MCO5089631.1 ABC transporter permease subunit [Bosea sp. (in: a-proteobacteria)]
MTSVVPPSVRTPSFARLRVGGVAQRALDSLILVVALIVIWQLLYDLVGNVALSSPLTTIRGAGSLLASGEFWFHTASTFKAFLLAMAIAVAGGVLIGIVLGSKQILREAYEPILVSFYTVPKVSFFPIILLLFGIGLAAQVAFGVIHGIVPTAIFTINAVKNVKPVLFKTANVLRLTAFQKWMLVVVPSVLPQVFTGIRIGVSLTFIGTILSEMFGSHRGLGYMLMQAIGINNGDLIMSLTLIITVWAIVLNSVLLFIDGKLHNRG